jgi:hypothetical protein
MKFLEELSLGKEYQEDYFYKQIVVEVRIDKSEINVTPTEIDEIKKNMLETLEGKTKVSLVIFCVENEKFLSYSHSLTDRPEFFQVDFFVDLEKILKEFAIKPAEVEFLELDSEEFLSITATYDLRIVKRA